MHRLILMRHAQAETSAPSGGGDEARPLSAAGRAEAVRWTWRASTETVLGYYDEVIRSAGR